MANIIIADDDEAYCMVVGDLLKDRGHQVSIVYNAAHLKALLQTVKPDLMIIDMHMPGGGGPAAMGDVRRSGLAAKPVIVCSGMPVAHQEEWARSQGLTNFACRQKPPDLPELGRLVDSLCGSDAPPPAPSQGA